MPSPQSLSESDRRLVAAWSADCAERVHWAMGFLHLDGWVFANPGLSGYYGAGGTFPATGWTMVVYTTTSQNGDQSAPTATEIFRQFTGVVTPEHSLAD